jgi:U3 small nucleolar RNA-associated protein 22
VFIAGSYLLKTVTKSPDGISVDLAVQMPESIFTEKDHMNHRYFHKRAFYLAVLASKLQETASETGFELKFESFNGDELRPILIVQSSTHTPNLYDFSSLKLVLRIIPTIPTSLFSVSKLSPTRNNVRPSHPTTTTSSDAAAHPPTPLYNSSLLHDTSHIAYLNALHATASSTPALRDAQVLSKVWLSQRGLGSLSFIWSMVMACLVRPAGTRGVGRAGVRLGAGYSAYQLVKLTMEFWATHDFVEEPLFLTKSGDALEGSEVSLIGVCFFWCFSYFVLLLVVLVFSFLWMLLRGILMLLLWMLRDISILLRLLANLLLIM